jgi:hypothetical protein
VNTSQTVARLEALLARVRKRAAEPRPARIPAQTPPMPQQRRDVDTFVEVEVAEAKQNTLVAVAAEEVVVPAALESRERLLAAEPLDSDASAADASPTEARAGEAVPAQGPEAPSDEEIDEAPASSRRPVGSQPEERLAEMAFGTEDPSPPRHTPPPESGRLPAIAPAEEFDFDTTGVREAAKKPAPRSPEPQPEPQAPPEIAPVAVRAEIATSSAVADVVGHAERAMPSRFVELLDASLGL